MQLAFLILIFIAIVLGGYFYFASTALEEQLPDAVNATAVIKAV